jgi:dihydroneopterin aldolase
MDFIYIRELRLEAWIGLYKYEKVAPQIIDLELEIAIPGAAVFSSHKVADTINYAAVVDRLRALLAVERFGLIEVLADRVAGVIIDEFHAPQVKVSVTKLGVLKESKRVGVCVTRGAIS